MSEDEKRRGGGAKTARTETVTVRLSPQSRYLAEIGARMQRRTLSSFIEWSVDKAIEEVDEDLWDVDEMDRFVNLALKVPGLMTYDEQILWKMVREVFPLLSQPRQFDGAHADRELLRKWNWVFQIAVRQNFLPSEVAKVIEGDKDLLNDFELFADAQAGPLAKEHPDTTREKAEAKAASKKAKKG